MNDTGLDTDAIDQREGLDIAVIGMAGRFPGAPDIETFWKNLSAGDESVSELSLEQLVDAGVDRQTAGRQNYVKARAILEGIDLFDAPLFGMTPREAEMTDPQQRILLECAWETFDRAGYDPLRYPGSIGVYAGSSTSGYLYQLFPRRVLLQSPAEMSAMLGVEKDSLATRLSYKLNLRGPSLAVQTACSTSLVAVHLACQALLSGECDMALAGGVSVTVPQTVGYLYQEGGIVSPDGHCRAFDAQAEGTVGGSGVGLVLLKRLQDALADSDHILAVIKGSAVNNDGSSKVGYTAPGIEGQARVIQAAHVAAGVDADSISYVEAHGTGTPMGDPIEVAGLTEAFRASTSRIGFCALGSVKTNIGHLDAAAGIAGLIKTILALMHRQIPASLHYVAPNPAIDFKPTPFYVNHTLSEWTGMTPRRAGVSSFGLGGTNAHVVLEEAPTVPAARVSTDAGHRLLILSARSKEAVDMAAERLADSLAVTPEVNLGDVAYTLQEGRRPLPYRRWVVAKTVEEARQGLAGHSVLSGMSGPITEARQVAFMFSGQGSQYSHMGRSLYEQEQTFRQHVDQCAVLLARHFGRDIRSILFPNVPGETELINRTAMTQPALFVFEYALARTWMSWGIAPVAMIGHSIGEYVAACLSGLFSLEDALVLVAMRGRLMQELPSGGMAAVPLTEAEVRPLLHAGLDLAAVNAPTQCVVSGPHELLKTFEHDLAERGIKIRRLATSHAFHSAMMEPMLARFSDVLAGLTFREVRIPWVSNLTGTWILREEAADPSYWVRHLRETVRFSAGLQTLLEAQSPVLLEVGPGRTLHALAQRHPEAAAAPVLASIGGRDQEEMGGLLLTLGFLWGAGVPIDWKGFHGGRSHRRVPLPAYPFERQRYWLEPREERAQSAPLDRRTEPSQWFYQPSWKRSSLASRAGQQAERHWLVFVDHPQTEDLLHRQLSPLVTSVTMVSPGSEFVRQSDGRYRLRPDSRDDHEALRRDLAGRGLNPNCLVQGWLLDGKWAQGTEASRIRAAQERGFLHLTLLAQVFAEPREACPSFLVLAQGLHDVTGEEHLRPERATVLGATLVLSQEYPGLICRLLDLDRTSFAPPFVDRWGARLVAEASVADLDYVVAYRGPHRWVRAFEPLRLAAADEQCCVLRKRAVCLITGGLGGVGLRIAEQLVRSRHARVMLVGRSVPTAEQRQMVAGLERLGGEVSICQADVADAAQMQMAIAETRKRFGGIHAVIHAAGVPGGGLLALKTPQSVREEFRAKVQGAAVLDNLLREEPLDLFLCCSSLTAVVGGVGQSTYCAANAYLDALAHAARRAGRRMLSVNFDRWRHVGMAIKAEAVLRTLGADESELDGMNEEESAEVLRRLMHGVELAQVVQSIRDLPAVIATASKPTALALAHRSRQDHATAAVSCLSTIPDGPEELEQQLEGLWRQVLGVELIGRDQDFFQAGGESLAALQILNRVQELYRLELSLRDFFSSPTVSGLAALIRAAQVSGAREDTGIVPVPRATRRLRGVPA
ncbi:MAG: SDR family NAD(P)-dependent oxidoreductase [Nitrospira sp.]|nr:SDR family NAD(P)-dependent oxidoreductase [Nitrospira sp.]